MYRLCVPWVIYVGMWLDPLPLTPSIDYLKKFCFLNKRRLFNTKPQFALGDCNYAIAVMLLPWLLKLRRRRLMLMLPLLLQPQLRYVVFLVKLSITTGDR